MERANYAIGEVLDKGIEDFTLTCGGYDFKINLKMLCHFINTNDDESKIELEDLCNCTEKTFTLKDDHFLCARVPQMVNIFISGYAIVTPHGALQLKTIVQDFNVHPTMIKDLIAQCDRIENESPADNDFFIQAESNELEKMDKIIQNKTKQIEYLLLIARTAIEVGPLKQRVAQLEEDLNLASTRLYAAEQDLNNTETLNSDSTTQLMDRINKYKQHFAGLEENINVLNSEKVRLQETCTQLSDELGAVQREAIVYDKNAMEKELANLSLHHLTTAEKFQTPIPSSSIIGFILATESPVVYLAGISLGHNKNTGRISSVEIFEGEMEPRTLKVFVLSYFQIIVLGSEKLNVNVPYQIAVTFESKAANRATSWQSYELKKPITVNAITLSPISDQNYSQSGLIGGFWLRTKL